MRLLKKKVAEKVEEVIEEKTETSGAERKNRIKIDENFFLTVQPYNVVLMEVKPKGEVPKGFKNVKASDVTTKEEAYGYYSNVYQALLGYLDAKMIRAISDQSINDVNGLKKDIENTRNDIAKFKEEFGNQTEFPYRAPRPNYPVR